MRNLNNLKKISKALLLEIGENPERTGLKDTPTRMAKMWIDIFKGYDKEQIPEVTVFPNGEDGITYNQIITDTGTFNSWCEHHMALFQGTYYFGYIPNKLIVGLSKIARVVDYFSARLQVQERLGENIVKYIDTKLKPQGMILIIKEKHTCKTVRGVKKDGNMTTSILTGIFKEDISARNEFLSLINL